MSKEEIERLINVFMDEMMECASNRNHSFDFSVITDYLEKHCNPEEIYREDILNEWGWVRYENK